MKNNKDRIECLVSMRTDLKNMKKALEGCLSRIEEMDFQMETVIPKIKVNKYGYDISKFVKVKPIRKKK